MKKISQTKEIIKKISQMENANEIEKTIEEVTNHRYQILFDDEEFIAEISDIIRMNPIVKKALWDMRI